MSGARRARSRPKGHSFRRQMSRQLSTALQRSLLTWPLSVQNGAPCGTRKQATADRCSRGNEVCGLGLKRRPWLRSPLDANRNSLIV